MFSVSRRVIAAVVLTLAALLALGAGAVPNARLKKTNNVRAAGKILDGLKGYKISVTNHSAIYFTAQDEDYARAAEGIIKTYLPLLAKDFGLDGAPFATLVIFPSKEEMYGSIGYNAQASGSAGAEPMGAYTAGILAALSPLCWAEEPPVTDAFISEGPVIHELAHFALDVKTNGNCPEWFSEGIALYYESKYTGNALRGAPTGKTSSYRELKTGFRRLNERESYRKSLAIIDFIVEKEGEKGLKYIYGRLRRGRSLDSALKKLLGDSFRELEGL